MTCILINQSNLVYPETDTESFVNNLKLVYIYIVTAFTNNLLIQIHLFQKAVAMVMPRIEQPSGTASGSLTGVPAASSAAASSVATPAASAPPISGICNYGI